MRTSPFAVALLLFVPHVAAQRDPLPGSEGKRLSYSDTKKRISWQGRVPSARWANDGRHVELRRGKEVLWLDPKLGQTVAKKDAAPLIAPPPSPTPRLVPRVYENDLWIDRVAGGRSPRSLRRPNARSKPGKDARRLTTDGKDARSRREAHLSPDERWASFTEGNDLILLPLDGGERWRVTTDGGPEQFHGRLDWVYQEEVYGRGNFQGHWWSPKSDLVAFLSLDERAVREFVVVDHVPNGFLDRERTVRVEASNYPKAGDPNPTASLSIARLDGRKVVAADLSRFPDDVLIVRVDWTPDGDTLLLTLQDRIQTWAELCACDPETGDVTTWIREESDTWVNRPASPRWLVDGTFLWMSERTGYRHVYHYRPGGELVKAVTAGDWQVRKIVRVDEGRGLLWFEGTKDGATGRHLYRIGLDGGGLVCLTPGVGTHSFDLNADGSFLIDRWSAMDMPTRVVVRSGETGEIVEDLGQADRGAGESTYAFSVRRRLTVRARDGYALDCSLILPVGWKEGERYPVYLPTYSGPNAPTVRDAWRYSTYEVFLAQKGFLVLQCNVRSASGRGQVDTGTAYRNLGVQELADLEDAVDHVVARYGGDPDRVAISGWSYGGFMTAFALTHSDKFALGLAGAGVYDWRLYDTIYTERYMRTPQENAEGYDRTSVIKAAAKLHGHLVLLHGTMDDNVHMQNTMQLLWELEKAGMQNFELMVYPRSRHGLNRAVSAHSREFQWRRLARLLEPPPAKPVKKAQAPAPKKVALFNGKNLDGWHADVPAADEGDVEPSFEVADGLLISRGTPPGHLITDASFSNYRLTVEWRWPGEAGNCGVLVHCSKPRRLYGMFPQSIECQLHSGNAGDFWCIGEDIRVPDMEARRGPKDRWGVDEGKARRIRNLTDGSEKPLGEWNTMVIECRGREIVIWVNGDLVNHGFYCTADGGRIAIQAEGARCEFRRLDIEPIPLEAADSEAAWQDLFDGRTLTGWTQKNGRAVYRVEGGAIVGRTVEGSPNSFLCTDREFGDFELEFEVKLDEELNSGMQIRSRQRESDGRVNGPQVEIEASGKKGGDAGYLYGEACGGWMTPAALRKQHKIFRDGAWNAYRVFAEGPRIRVWLNGVPVSDLVDENKFKTHPRGFLGLQVHAVPKGAGPYEVRWRKLRIREF